MPPHDVVRLAVAGMLGLALLTPIAWAGISGGTRDLGAVPTTQAVKPPATQPSVDLSPQQVVKVVVDALQKNDNNDSGIRTTFNFASPANKAFTGPLDRFIPMVKNPLYQPMLNHQSAEYGVVEGKDDQAHQLVILTTPGGEKVYYIFQLSRQAEGEFKDCWMTDGVYRVEPGEVPPPGVPGGPPIKA